MTTDRALVATRKGLFLLRRRAGAWRVDEHAFVGDNVPMASWDPIDDTVYAVVGHGHFGTKVHRRKALGAWEEVAAPKYPEKPEGEVDIDPIRQQPLEWTLEMIWALEPGGPGRPGRLWAGTVPGGLFRSDDRGESWTLMRSLWEHPDRKRWSGGGMDRAGIHSVVVDPRDPDHVLIAVSCGGVWRTRDAGATWAITGPGLRAEYLPPELAFDPVTQDPHRLVACPAAPDRLWIQHHNGIFRSVDGAASWQEITHANPSVFGFAVAVDPNDPDTAYFVPAIKDERRIPVDGHVVVSRTRDGGKSFEVLREGLPQDHAFDLVFRHALDIDGTGTRLMFGSTTGNLYVTEDRGEHWSVVSHHLPPIYCVRFFGDRIRS